MDNTPWSVLDTFIPGRPAPQGSKTNYHGRMIESSKHVKPWRTDIRDHILAYRLPTIQRGHPMRVELVFIMPRPKSHYRTGKWRNHLRDDAPFWHTSKPDSDKLARAVLDAIGSAGTYADDSQVVDLRSRKRYALVEVTNDGHAEETPGLALSIEVAI